MEPQQILDLFNAGLVNRAEARLLLGIDNIVNEATKESK